MENLNPETELYSGGGSTIRETIVSGAVGGALWGTVAGILAAIGIFQSASLDQGTLTPSSLLPVAAMSMLGLIAGGAFVGSMIGLFLGWGIASEDRYVNEYTLRNGQVFMRAIVDESLASTAWQILNQVDLEARILHAHPV